MLRFKIIMKWLLALLFAFAGISHFVSPDLFVKIMPPYLPWHRELVAFSGVMEIILGLLLLTPRGRNLAAWGLIVLLIAVFPANISMAMNPNLYPQIPEIVLWLRLPLQGLLIAWAWWFTNSRRHIPANEI